MNEIKLSSLSVTINVLSEFNLFLRGYFECSILVYNKHQFDIK